MPIPKALYVSTIAEHAFSFSKYLKDKAMKFQQPSGINSCLGD